MQAVNIKDVKNPQLMFMPSMIKFNSLDEWEKFKEKHIQVLRRRRDWYFNPDELLLVQ